MNVLVCISNVPDTTAKITFTDNNTRFNTSGVQFIINPYDEIALARAIELTEAAAGTVTVINVGDESSEPTIRKALAIGATNAIRINAFPHDAFFVASQIAAYVKANSFDLILTGSESIDYNGSQVAEMLAELLGLPSVSLVKKLEITDDMGTIARNADAGTETVAIALPFVAGIAEGAAIPKLANMRGIMAARTKPLKIVEPVAVALSSEISCYVMPEPKGGVKLISSAEPEQLVSLLHNQAGVI